MSAATRHDGISRPQMRLLWVLARDHGYDEDGLRDLVEAVTGRRSISGLTRRQASEIIERLRGPRRPLPAARRDLRKLHALWGELGRRGWYRPEARQKALRAFLEKRFGVSDPRFLTPNRARLVIEALKAIVERMS